MFTTHAFTGTQFDVTEMVKKAQDRAITVQGAPLSVPIHNGDLSKVSRGLCTCVRQSQEQPWKKPHICVYMLRNISLDVSQDLSSNSASITCWHDTQFL